VSRHPYTYACDLIRCVSPKNLSRCDASKIRQTIAEALGIEDEELATKLSEYYQKNEERLKRHDKDEFINVAGDL
jgi:hypothetical protein